jgi:2-oxoisovalerate dehydrogenase E1 component alpha subunit
VKIVARFEIPYFQYLNEAGVVVDTLPEFAKDPKNLIELYRLMVLTRVFDTKAIALQRTGKLGTYPSTRGQEAVFVGVGAGMAKNDILVPYYRDIGALIQRGVELKDILLYWGGDERGNTFAGEDFPYSVPVGSQPLHAAGVATALKIRKQARAVVAVCGEGATSQGDFYEAINLAGVWQLPIVFVVCNNQWAISVPRSAQSAAQTIAQKAIAAGFAGEQVDGNDVIAVQARVAAALTVARDMQSPTLIEIDCYRHSDHTTADDARRYEPEGVRESHWSKEPITRLQQYLEKNKWWDATKETALQEECNATVEAQVAEYLATEPQSPATAFDYLYEKLPDIYTSQRDDILSKEINSHD